MSADVKEYRRVVPVLTMEFFRRESVVISPIQALLFCLFSYLFVSCLLYANNYFPGGVDTSNHLFQIWFIQEHGLTAWNPYWYAGTPLLDQYPFLTHYLPALLSNLVGVITSYKLFSALGFILLPLSLWFFLDQFEINFEKSFALLFFSFSAIFIHYYQQGVYSSLISFNLVILYFAFLKRVLDRGEKVDMLLAAITLSVCSFSHALNPGYCVVFSIPFILAFSEKKLKAAADFAVIMLGVGLLSCWFWIPYLVNYSLPKSTPFEIGFAWLFAEIGRTFVVSVNYVGLFFLAVFLPVLAYIFLTNIVRKRDLRYTFFLIGFVITILIIRLVPLSALGETRRMLFFIPLFLCVFVSKGLSRMKYGKVISALLILPLLLLFFTYQFESVNVNSEVYGLMSFVKNSAEERFLVVPESFDLMTVNKSYSPVAETVYSTFLIPYAADKEVLNGWWPTGSISIDKPAEYAGVSGFGCERTKSYNELFSSASYVNKNTLVSRKTCVQKLNATVYCAYAREASLDYVVVNKFFPEVDSYVSNLSCVEKAAETNNFLVYQIVGEKPFVNFSNSSIASNYSKTPGKIIISFNALSAGLVNATITESYAKHWKAYLDGEEVGLERTSYGFLNIAANAGAGAHILVLEYKPENFGNALTYVSLVSWLLAIVLLALIVYPGGSEAETKPKAVEKPEIIHEKSGMQIPSIRIPSMRLPLKPKRSKFKKFKSKLEG